MSRDETTACQQPVDPEVATRIVNAAWAAHVSLRQRREALDEHWWSRFTRRWQAVVR